MKTFLKILFGLRAGMNSGTQEEMLRKIEEGDGIESNYSALRVFSLIGACCVLLMLVMTFFNPVVSRHRVVYMVGTAASFGLFFLSGVVYRRNRKRLILLVYTGIAAFLLYGMALGLYTDPGMQSTTFFVMMIFVPSLFIDRPKRIILFVAAFDVLFLVLTARVKTGAVRSADLTDGTIFGILSLVSIYYSMYIKYSRFYALQQNYRLGNIDQLTGVKNRNCYETEKSRWESGTVKTLTFVFTDANGLHELNNAKGHKAGDEMLQCVARELEKAFGSENLYRLGGDEFVVLAPDAVQTQVEERLQQARTAIAASGYHIACGLHTHCAPDINLEALSLAAEEAMYADKRNFYHSTDIRR